MLETELMQTPSDDVAKHFDPKHLTRRAERVRQHLRAPFVFVVCVIAFWAIARAAEVIPAAIDPVIDKMPPGAFRLALIWIRDIAKPIGHYSSKLFAHFEPAAHIIVTWFRSVANAVLKAFTDWIDSL